uniref:Uncharacterized protein n=1 Tax=Arundo donax TaxID=35708 RepID=A0A0A8ZUN2_ARUDO
MRHIAQGQKEITICFLRSSPIQQ